MAHNNAILEFLAQSDDPRLQKFAEIMAQRAEGEAAVAELERKAAETKRKETGTPEQLKQRVRTLIRDLAALEARNDALAAALGACYLCWGEDPTCEVCHGRGRPGAAPPASDWFDVYVRPVAVRMGRARRRRATATTTLTNATPTQQGDAHGQL